MAENKQEVEANGRRRMVRAGVRKLFLAGVGAALLAQDELNKQADRLVDRGELTREKGREKVDKMVSARRKRAKQAMKEAESDFGKRMEGVLHRINMPTRTEIKGLSSKITKLTKKVDELGKTSA